MSTLALSSCRSAPPSTGRCSPPATPRSPAANRHSHDRDYRTRRRPPDQSPKICARGAGGLVTRLGKIARRSGGGAVIDAMAERLLRSPSRIRILMSSIAHLRMDHRMDHLHRDRRALTAGFGAILLALSLLVWPSAGATAQLEASDRNGIQVGVNANYYQLKNPDSGLCLTLYSGNMIDGTPLVAMPCAQAGMPNELDFQRWERWRPFLPGRFESMCRFPEWRDRRRNFRSRLALAVPSTLTNSGLLPMAADC